MKSAAIAILMRYAGEKIVNKIKICFLIVFLLIVSAVLTYLAIPRISIALLAKNYELNIFYKSVKFTPHIYPKNAGGFKVDISLKDVRISKKNAVTGVYDDIGALVSAPFDGSLKYREIKGVIRPRLGYILIDNLIANGDDVKVSLKGTFFYAQDKADLGIVMQFSRALLNKIPQELSTMILKECPDGWKSLSINLKGSFKSPAIEVTGNLFRLSIKEISGS